METLNKTDRFNRHIGVGIFIVLVGLLMMLSNLGLNIPHWIISWNVIMLVAGLWIGFRKNFRISGWLILVIIGGIYTFRDLAFFDISRYTGSMVLIALGTYMIFKPKRKQAFWDFNDRKRAYFQECRRAEPKPEA